MKTLIQVKQAKQAVRFVSSVLKVKSNLPVLNTIRISSNGHCEMSATDLDVTAKAILPCETARDGVAIVPGNSLKLAVSSEKRFPQFEIDAAGNSATIKSGDSVQTVATFAQDEYPAELADFKGVIGVTFPAPQFFSALASVQAAMSKDSSRYVLQSVLIQPQDDHMRLVATNGRILFNARLESPGIDPSCAAMIQAAEASRLAAHAELDAAYHAQSEAEKQFPPTFKRAENLPMTCATRALYERAASPQVEAAEKITIAAKAKADKADDALKSAKTGTELLLTTKAVKAILAIPQDGRAGNLKIQASGNFCQVTAGNYSVVSKLLEGNYPTWKQVVPRDFKDFCRVNAQAMIDAIKTARVAATEKSKGMLVVISDNVLTLSCKDGDGARSVASIGVSFKSKPFAISIDPAYLLATMESVLELQDVTDAELKWIDELSPLTVESFGRHWQAVIMPMRMS